MNCLEKLLEYKIFGAFSLILASLYIIIYSIGKENFVHHLLWALIILLFGLFQLYENFILKRNPQHIEKEVKDKNEVKPLIKEEYPVVILHVKELEALNNEIDILEKDKEPNHQVLFYKFVKEIKKFFNFLKIEIKI